MKVKYNSPVILTFALLCCCVNILLSFFPFLYSNFTLPIEFDFFNLKFWYRIFSYVLGHSGLPHLSSNLMFLLLIGPIVEEKYGSKNLIKMILITTLATAIIHIHFFNRGLLGASGIVYMIMFLATFTNYKKGNIPITMILILIIYGGSELLKSFSEDAVSQFAHISGAIFGSIFGFCFYKKL